MGDSVALGFVCNNRFDEIGKELNDYVKSQESDTDRNLNETKGTWLFF